MSDFGFVNRRDTAGGKRTSVNGNVGPMPNTCGGDGNGAGRGVGAGAYAGDYFGSSGGGGQQQQQFGISGGGGARGGRGGGRGGGGAGGRGGGPSPQQRQPRPSFPVATQRPPASRGEEDWGRQQLPPSQILAPVQPPPPPPSFTVPDLDEEVSHPRSKPSVSFAGLPATGSGSSPTPTAAAPSVPLQVLSQLSSAQKEIAALKASIADLTEQTKLATAGTKDLRDSVTHFFGLVQGGASNRALLFDKLPKDMTAERAVAKADKDTWVRLSYPQTRVERTLANGSTQIDLWLRAYAICPRTSDVNVYWVRDKAEDDTPAFKRFAWYPSGPGY